MSPTSSPVSPRKRPTAFKLRVKPMARADIKIQHKASSTSLNVDILTPDQQLQQKFQANMKPYHTKFTDNPDVQLRIQPSPHSRLDYEKWLASQAPTPINQYYSKENTEIV